jgi:hypothetical protein
VSAVAALTVLRHVATVALLAARSAARSPLVLVALLLVLVAPPVWGVVGGGDAPVVSLKTLLSWSTDSALVVLTLTTVFMTTALATDLKRGHLTQVTVAPLRREALLIGWWLGCVAVLAVLAVAAALSIGVTATLAAGDDEGAVSVLQARGVSSSIPPDADLLRASAEREYERRRRAARLPSDVSPEQVLEQLERIERTRKRTVARGGTVDWFVRGVEPQGDPDAIVLRFRCQVQTTAAVRGSPTARGRFLFGPPGSPQPLHSVAGNWAPNTWHMVGVPVGVLAGGTSLQVTFQNLNRGPVVVLFPETGVSVLYAAGSFPPNLLRLVLVLLGRLAFLAAVGVACASLIEGRLAAGVVLWFLFLGASVSFLQDALVPGLFGALDAVLRPLLDGVLWGIADLGRVDLADRLAMGELVTWEDVGESLGLDGFLRGGLLLLMGSVAFAARELGAIRS